MGKAFLRGVITFSVIVILLLVAFFAVLQFSGLSCIKKIDRSVPGATTAQWQVVTPMHQYYANTVSTKTDAAGVVSVTMTGWYEKINGKWVKQSATITLDRKNYGKITVERRTK